MKKNFFISFSVLSLTSIFFIIANNIFYSQESKAYPINDLPTTINLNDNSSFEIREYYSSLNNFSKEERQGTNLLKNLKSILKKDQKYYSYDNEYNKLWQIYEISDRDWNKSPASSITYGTYDPSSNSFIDYQYGTSALNVKNNPFIHALYINRNIDNQSKAWGEHKQTAWGINREHVWPKSHGFDAPGGDSTGGARGDVMSLVAGNGYANLLHWNYFYAFVDKNREYVDAGTKYGTAYNNLVGYSTNAGGEEKVFEPQDGDKGDIARIVFYMAARYNFFSGQDSEAIDGNNPNLILSNDFSGSEKCGTSSATEPYSLGLISDLLAWNKLDPVDEYEIHRNNLLFNNFTNNRNPFIDFPEWANYIWGSADIDGKNYNPTVTGFADPINDPINGESDTFVVSTDNILLEKGKNTKIYANNADSDISWSIEDPSIISLSQETSKNKEEIIVTALKNGSTTIHASALFDGEIVTRDVLTKVEELTLTSLTLSNYKKDFKINETFSTDGLVVVANYSNGTKETITSGYSVSKPDMSKEGKQFVTVSFQGISASYEINITNPNTSYLIYGIIGLAIFLLLVIVIIIFIKSNKKNRKKITSTINKSVKTYKKQNKKK